MELPGIKAQKDGEVEVPAPVVKRTHKGEVVLTISLKQRVPTNCLAPGHEIAWFQHVVKPAYPSTIPTTTSSRSRSKPAAKLSTSTTTTELKIAGPTFEFIFDRARGHLKSWTSGGDVLLSADPTTRAAILPSFNRPFINNDAHANGEPYWKKWGVHRMTSSLLSLEHGPISDDEDKCGGGVRVTARTRVAPIVVAWGWLCDMTYTIDPRGNLTLTGDFRRDSADFGPEHLPRIGLDLHLNKSLNQVTWHGLGPGESYPDKLSAQRRGIFNVPKLQDLETHYDIPQEFGNHVDTRWVSITSASLQGRGLRATKLGDKPFHFVAKRFSDEAVDKALHPPELVEDETATHMRLDMEVAGVGTGACGPAVREDLMVWDRECKFSFYLESI